MQDSLNIYYNMDALISQLTIEYKVKQPKYSADLNAKIGQFLQNIFRILTVMKNSSGKKSSYSYVAKIYEKPFPAMEAFRNMSEDNTVKCSSIYYNLVSDNHTIDMRNKIPQGAIKRHSGQDEI